MWLGTTSDTVEGGVRTGDMYTRIHVYCSQPQDPSREKNLQVGLYSDNFTKLRPSPLYYVQKGWPPRATLTKLVCTHCRPSSRSRRPSWGSRGYTRTNGVTLRTCQKPWSWDRMSNTTHTKRALRRARRPVSKDRFAHGAQEEKLTY